MTRLLYGKEIAEKRIPNLRERAAVLRGAGVVPCLAAFRVGDRGDDLAYGRMIARLAETVGVDMRLMVMPPETERTRLIERIAALNDDPSVHGVLIFRPLPEHADESAVCAALDPRKDVDGVTPASMAALYAGAHKSACAYHNKGENRGEPSGVPIRLKEGFAPCTAEAVVAVLDHFGIETEGKRAVIIGRSAVIGKPVSLLLLSRNATVTICHRKTGDLPRLASSSDILVVAAGLAARGRDFGVGEQYFNLGQTVVDVGIHADASGKLYGDVNAGAAMGSVANLTPVPGGVGTVTTLVLLEHTLQAAEDAAR
ncbi:MAG: bifunctional 5,10-methylenetetrahydrofolate dehydrogenase/5,10-methenyltetrahydrofolate cyclohydrolase [Clostridiales Family XIII bacterium]|jgi:methylenetetrahydrofolate dehydrogenase (NADP+)/methenyltetrahydrofolate cyclohydrolase|nr:bifunctional 5,10-methylenetetrahydrofolate dehydrogenase/5,10-methenyltetrahydrofolate cyclohydrolase [Clostridiales Family XIII bacterium]